MSARPMLILLLGLALAAAGAISAFAQSDPSAQANAQACQQEFGKIKDDIEKKGAGLRAAGQRKVRAPAKEICQLLRHYNESEAKMIKFFDQKKTACQIPDQVVKQVKDGHTKSLAMQTQICKVAESGGEAPPPPSMGLSGALGTTVTPGNPLEDPAGSSGVFDTLTGNVLKQ